MSDLFQPTKPIPKPKEQPKDEWITTNNPNVLLNPKTGMRRTKDMIPPPPVIDYEF